MWNPTNSRFVYGNGHCLLDDCVVRGSIIIIFYMVLLNIDAVHVSGAQDGRRDNAPTTTLGDCRLSARRAAESGGTKESRKCGRYELWPSMLDYYMDFICAGTSRCIIDEGRLGNILSMPLQMSEHQVQEGGLKKSQLELF